MFTATAWLILVSPVSLCVCVWTDFVNVIASQDTVMKLHRCVVEIKMKAEFKDGRGSRGEVDP